MMEFNKIRTDKPVRNPIHTSSCKGQGCLDPLTFTFRWGFFGLSIARYRGHLFWFLSMYFLFMILESHIIKVSLTRKFMILESHTHTESVFDSHSSERVLEGSVTLESMFI